MINPTPVNTKNSPYSTPSSNGRPTLPKQVPNVGVKKHRGWKRVMALSVLVMLLASGSYAFAYVNSIKSTVTLAHQGDRSTALSLYNNGGDANSALLKKTGDGRFNLLMVGVGGEDHPGGNLTDSIQILSIDPVNKSASITSIPRDLYVNIPNYGYSKINAAYNIGEQRKKGDGGYLLRQTLGTVLGTDISNFILIDFSGAKDLIDQLGGIDVNVPKAIVDPLFPCDDTVKYCPFSIKAGLQHMNGTTALKYSRSRETTSDFDRSARQQLVIEAMKKKALSAGTLANPVKVLGLISSAGKHLRTDLQTDEITTFFELYKNIQSGSTTTQVLDTSANLGLLTSSSGTSAGYIAYPALGQGNYAAVQAWFQKNNTDPYIIIESPTVTVSAGGSASAKQVATIVEYLKEYGFKAVAGTLKAPSNVTRTTVYATREDKHVSSNYLGSYFGVIPAQDDPLSSGSDFEVIYVPAAKK